MTCGPCQYGVVVGYSGSGPVRQSSAYRAEQPCDGLYASFDEAVGLRLVLGKRLLMSLILPANTLVVGSLSGLTTILVCPLFAMSLTSVRTKHLSHPLPTLECLRGNDTNS